MRNTVVYYYITFLDFSGFIFFYPLTFFLPLWNLISWKSLVEIQLENHLNIFSFSTRSDLLLKLKYISISIFQRKVKNTKVLSSHWILASIVLFVITESEKFLQMSNKTEQYIHPSCRFGVSKKMTVRGFFEIKQVDCYEASEGELKVIWIVDIPANCTKSWWRIQTPAGESLQRWWRRLRVSGLQWSRGGRGGHL